MKTNNEDSYYCFIPNEANAISYNKHNGDWLKPHVDDRQLSLEPIANLSLAGNCIMTFCNTKGQRRQQQQQNQQNQKVMLPRRCLQILTGKSRYDYSHGISNNDLLSNRRVSITMRHSPLTKTQSKNTF